MTNGSKSLFAHGMSQLMIKCTKPGVAHITVKAVGGGNRPGTGSVMGGIEITKTFAVIARETGAENGGWL